MPEPYEQQTWANEKAGGTPVNAERLGVMEAGIAAGLASGAGDLYYTYWNATSPISLADGALVPLPPSSFDQVDSDTYLGESFAWDPDDGTGGVVILKTGLYLITVQVSFDFQPTDTSGYCEAFHANSNGGHTRAHSDHWKESLQIPIQGESIYYVRTVTKFCWRDDDLPDANAPRVGGILAIQTSGNTVDVDYAELTVERIA
jgi:hypothetical protein